MSNTSESKHNTSVCANCGKGEEAGIDLKACMACKLVKYCSRDCQVAHRPQHKKECKKRAKELHNEKLFEQPPPLEDCPLCMIRLPTLAKGRTYMNCCGKVICTGCGHAPVYDHEGNEIAEVCPFCRTQPPDSDEQLKQFKKRIELNDGYAMFTMGSYYAGGRHGLPQSRAKALELWHRAGELGFSQAYHNIGAAYKNGNGVERDEKKSKHYFELSAIGGCVEARYNLGNKEWRLGNINRAMKHYMIAVKDGDSNSLENIKRMYGYKHATKDDYAKALHSYQAYLDEIRTAQRDEAAAYTNSVYY